MRRIAVLLALGVLALGGTSLRSATTQEKPIYKATGSEGTIVGTISFAGTPAKPWRIDTSADPVCTSLSPYLTTDWVVVKDHKLANVFVYVRGENLNLYSFEPSSPTVVLEHKGCRYEPHVFGMQTQQTLRVLNDDNTTHNTHPTPKNNREWNQSQPAGAVIEQRFAWPELFIPIKDNQHPWEKAYVGVLSHPFFSVSATDGTYKISGVPPGQYTVVAWHEKLGEQTVDVFLAGSEQKTLDFTFKASDH
jgi:hypothetical protein